MRRRLSVGIVHAPYLTRGGEDLAVADMAQILEARGHDVDTLLIDPVKPTAKTMLFDRAVYQRIAVWLSKRFDVVHAHNTFPRAEVPLRRALHCRGGLFVQHVHNYRRSCLSANHFRDGRECLDCDAASRAWAGVRHACYRGSAVASAGSLVHHAAAARVRWRRPDVYVALSEAMRPLVEPTLPTGAVLEIVPNGLATDPKPGQGGNGAIFVGRLTQEKGVLGALDAADRCGIPLTVVGDGPLRQVVSARAARWYSTMQPAHVLRLVAAADVMLAPSEWQEPFGRVLIEALAVGTPVLTLGRGAAMEIWPDGACASWDELVQRLRRRQYIEQREAALRVYSDNFSAQPIAAALERVYYRHLR